MQFQLEYQETKRLKKLDEFKTRLYTNISHEFRTPLSTILSSVSLIEKYDQLGNTEKKKVHFEKVKNNIKSLTNMLNDTLTISRIEENTGEVELARFNVLDLIHEVIEESEGLRKSKQEIIVNFAGEKVINSDRKILKTVLVNIVNWNNPNQKNKPSTAAKNVHVFVEDFEK